MSKFEMLVLRFLSLILIRLSAHGMSSSEKDVIKLGLRMRENALKELLQVSQVESSDSTK